MNTDFTCHVNKHLHITFFFFQNRTTTSHVIYDAQRRQGGLVAAETCALLKCPLTKSLDPSPAARGGAQ